ncbi:hypothetical protein EST38_g7058 [Candolleomyces aberdarensis]|uniref:F-box domain-containing protein n=1 Tax=Candolleomyces aberdarensis TaxID=2316362 RepID=A0A4Q2DJF9_9AGAR|nr:hypothetical protein EST38_g7058 [Candolleomyces aberdarensis]
MVTTRRNGGTLSNPADSKALKEAAADYDMDSISSDQESGNYSDDDSDDGDFDVRKSSVKRRKTATNAKAGNAAKSARRRKDLSLLPTMPLDILYEIFGQLSPKDLISLSRTNKLFRKTLLASTAITVWKAAREECNAPEPSRGFTEPQWSALLFLTFCWSCGAKGVPKVDWYLRRRVCIHCKKNHLVHSDKFKSRFPDYEPEVLNYVTFTHSKLFSFFLCDSKFYWDDDIHPIVEQWRKLQHAVHLGQSGARELFENWKEQRKEHLEYVAKMAQTYEAWYQNMTLNKDSDAADNRKKRLEAVKAKFLDLGYDAVDINRSIFVHSDGISTGTPNVTNAVWSRLRPKLEPAIEAERNRREARELELKIKERVSILDDVYGVYLSSFKPSDRCFCPPAQFLRPLPEVPILDDIATRIAKYQEERRQFAMSTLPETENQAAGSLSLAKNVFTIITTAGLDPSTASLADMDQKDARFVCDNCFSARFKNIYTWRGALLHGPRHFSYTKNPTFTIAPDTLAAEAKTASASIRQSARAWSCNHCHSFIDEADAQTQEFIFEHLKTQHAISDPVITQDYFINEQCQELLEAPYRPSTSVTTSFQCLECPSGKASDHRFTESDVRRHLKNEHNITNPVAHVHFWNHMA